MEYYYTDAEGYELEMKSRQQREYADAGRKVPDESGHDGLKKDEVTNENGNPTMGNDDDGRKPIVPLTVGETEDTVENSHIIFQSDQSHTEPEVLDEPLLNHQKEARVAERETAGVAASKTTESSATTTTNETEAHDKEHGPKVEVTILVQHFSSRADTTYYKDSTHVNRIIKVD